MDNFIHREIETEIHQAATQYPVVTITGPRQSGKTTIVKHCFPDKAYLNLEAPDIRLLAQQDPRYFLQQYPDGLILDEIQHVPQLLSYIQTIVDEQEKTGIYILTGSQNLALNEAITQSLAGRTALLELLPMTLNELKQVSSLNLNQQLLIGGYPRTHVRSLVPVKMYRQYVQTYLERDVRQLSNIHDLATFQKFMRLCASRTAQLLNINALSNEAGISVNTAKHWLSILEASYIIFRLQPFHSNLKKRLVKTPKLYFIDTGLASYLLGIENEDQISRDPLRGHLFENMIVLEFIKQRLNKGLEPACYFYRDSTGNEVDLILVRGRKLHSIEIKVGQTFQPGMLKGLRYFSKILGPDNPQGFLVYSGDQEQPLDNYHLINYLNVSQID